MSFLGYAYDNDCIYVNGTGSNNYEFFIQLNRCGTLGGSDHNKKRDANFKNTEPTVSKKWLYYFKLWAFTSFYGFLLQLVYIFVFYQVMWHKIFKTLTKNSVTNHKFQLSTDVMLQFVISNIVSYLHNCQYLQSSMDRYIIVRENVPV